MTPLTLGDFSQQRYQPACLFARLLRCAKGYIARLCTPLRALQANENPAQSGNFISANRLMTMTVNHWLPLFTRPQTVESVLSSWRHLQANDGVRLHGYCVVLENHLHLIGGSARIGQDIQRFKSYRARRIIAQLLAVRAQQLLDLLALFKRLHKSQCEHQLWEEGSHPQRSESEGVMRQKLEYIHYNPVQLGFVDLPEHWHWSSARDYGGLAGWIEVDREW